LWALTVGTVAGGQPSIEATRYATPAMTPTPAPPTLVWPVAAPGPVPAEADLTAALAAISTEGAGTVAWAVVNPWDDQRLTSQDGDGLMVPASTLKLITSAAALQIYGAEHRFATRVVSSADGIILVGGGDPDLTEQPASGYPARASLVDLADRTAAALAAAGTTSVALGYDDTLFAGPTWNEAWEDGDDAWTSPTSALWMDKGLTNGGRSTTPAADAAAEFADLLRQRGLTVNSVNATPAAADAAVVAEVNSPPLRTIIEECLLASDNDVAEVLFRHVGRAQGGDGSIVAAQQSIQTVATELGLWTEGMVIRDGSGLSYDNQVTPAVIARAIGLGFRDPAYRALVTGLPVAGGVGTLGLSWRYDEPSEVAARGVVRAKTGTLTSVHTLGGFVQTRSGAFLAFSVTSHDGTDAGARDWLDRATAALASL
jgi:D-alanyl-D-alanine carboxypeptidase/D-alanyl-D-alanine-endopeptidase (penicillin-binding protein 4)